MKCLRSCSCFRCPFLSTIEVGSGCRRPDELRALVFGQTRATATMQHVRAGHVSYRISYHLS